MTEYWVSKKQYWCKYCNIFIRDDAPSRKQHETGLKHQGSKERFIRDLYKTGNQAKRDKANEEIEMARINAAAEAAHAHDTQGSSSRPSALAAIQAASARAQTTKKRETRNTDKWANYSSAKDLGFDDEDTQKSTYEIEQEIKGRAAPIPGTWQEVADEPQYPAYGEDAAEGSFKRKLGEYEVNDEDDGENFKFQHRDKRPVKDIYDDDDWDPKKALGKLKFKSKENGKFGKASSSSANGATPVEEQAGGLDRTGWTGKLELQAGDGERPEGAHDGMKFLPNGGGWVKAKEDDEDGEADQKPDVATTEDVEVAATTARTLAGEDVKPALNDKSAGQGVSEGTIDEKAPLPPAEVNPEPAAATTMFKKRRPPPSNRKKE